MRKTISLVLLDADDFEVSSPNDDFDSIKAAKALARLKLGSEELIAHGMVKAEVRVNGECVFDLFVPQRDLDRRDALRATFCV